MNIKDWRIYFLAVIILLMGGGIIARLFSLQILEFDYYSVLAQDQHQLYQTLFPARGEIFMQDLSVEKRTGQKQYSPLAINKEFKQVYAVPYEIDQGSREETANKLSELLEMDKEVILKRISKSNDPYEPLKHKVSSELAQEIDDLAFAGIRTASETWRYYPNNILACHLTGFVGIADDQKIGQYGLEGYYEEELKGEAGFMSGEKDTAGYWIPYLSHNLESAQDGKEIILTIDQNNKLRIKRWGKTNKAMNGVIF